MQVAQRRSKTQSSAQPPTSSEAPSPEAGIPEEACCSEDFLGMQGAYGNAFVQRLATTSGPPSEPGVLGKAWDGAKSAAGSVVGALGSATSWVGDRVGDALDTRENEAEKDAAEDLEDFMSETYETKNFHPSTGRGLFNAEYDPKAGLMMVNLKIYFDFKPGDSTNTDWIAAVGGAAAAAAYTADQFVWTDAEKEGWKSNAMSTVTSAWSDQYTFHNTRPHWEGLPTVGVRIQIVDSEQADAHFVVTVRKWPKDGGQSDSITPPGSSSQSTGRLHESADNGITTPDVETYTTNATDHPKYMDALNDNPGQVFFDTGKSDVKPADEAKLRKFGQTLGRGTMPPFPVTVTGHSNLGGSDATNQSVSEDRARTVSNIIVSSGAQTQPTARGVGTAGADATEVWRRADIAVEPFVSNQTTLVHETGHMLGMGDEYATTDPAYNRDVGQESPTSDTAEKLIPGQQPILAHEDDSLMSVGSEIRPYHYVTFLEAIGKMSATEGQWAIGAGGKLRMQEPGATDLPPLGNVA